MLTIIQTQQAMIADPKNWRIPFMDFVDDFRYHRNTAAIDEPFQLSIPRFEALLASTAEYLCDELGIEPPGWLAVVPCLDDPWFVADMKGLRTLAVVEVPPQFRRRNIFVLRNFLNRV